ncbi:MAG TPA: TRAP transporter substrate-binding protein [Alphaproteobacteria bacterium]
MLAGGAQAATWDMPTPYPEGNFHTINIKQFADDVKAATGGKLEISVKSAGSLIKHPEIKNAVRSGQVPIGEFLLSLLANENPIFGADSVPFLADNYDLALKLWQAQRPLVEKAFDRQGLMVLFSVPWPPQGIYAKKQLNAMEDMKGLKFRAYNAATQRIAQLAGAIPTQIEAADIAPAFATGRVEAMITSPSTGADSKAWDYVSYYHNTQAWLPKNIVVVNKDAFAALDQATRQAVIEAAKKAEARGWAASKEETAKKTKILADNGMKIVEPSARLKAGFAAIGKTMTEEWVKSAGADGKALLEAYRK